MKGTYTAVQQSGPIQPFNLFWECLERIGAGIGGVLGGGGVAKVVTIVVGWIAVEGWWWLSDSLGSSLTVSSLTSGKSGCSDLATGIV